MAEAGAYCGACGGVHGGTRGGTQANSPHFKRLNLVRLDARGSLEDIGNKKRSHAKIRMKYARNDLFGTIFKHLVCDENWWIFGWNKVKPNVLGG